jgi:hypothetical protein
MRSLNTKLNDFEIFARHRVGEMHFSWAAIDEADWVVVNGEGTIHHDQLVAQVLMEGLKAAQESGKRTALLNSIYQDMNPHYRPVLQKLDILTVRDPFSEAITRDQGGDPTLMIDLCVDEDYLGTGNPRPSADICKGDAHSSARIEGKYFQRKTRRFLKSLPYTEVSLTSRFEDVIATLKNAQLYVTGQYHGIYACGLAGTPFVCFSSNSHKIEALLDWSQLPIPICYDVRDLEKQMRHAVDNGSLFTEFREFLLSQPRHTRTFFHTRMELPDAG